MNIGTLPCTSITEADVQARKEDACGTNAAGVLFFISTALPLFLWWRRGESNSCPKALFHQLLRAQSVFLFKNPDARRQASIIRFRKNFPFEPAKINSQVSRSCPLIRSGGSQADRGWRQAARA